VEGIGPVITFRFGEDEGGGEVVGLPLCQLTRSNTTEAVKVVILCSFYAKSRPEIGENRKRDQQTGGPEEPSLALLLKKKKKGQEGSWIVILGDRKTSSCGESGH
jgi:hypothetical protein